MNMSLDFIDENPQTILKHSIKSQKSRRCSRDFNLRLVRRAKYDKFRNPGSLFVKARWTLSMALMR